MRKSKFVNILATYGLFLVYIQVRAMYLPVFWLGFPAWDDWQKVEDEKRRPFFVARDLPRLFSVWAYLFVTFLISALAGSPWLLVQAFMVMFACVVLLYNWVVMKVKVRKYRRIKELEEMLNSQK